ncbi:hypothetical protein [Shumkonia mesophila]|uniref:hypothetical protein n=1 Tax=Shumkonia mesophila TaxID=2838854 RepID=UPI002934FFB6|nr:hypothetical protein [Shumkonia mesophila]
MLKARAMMAELSSAFEALSEEQRAWLEEQGIVKVAFLAAGGIGVLPIVAWEDGHFEPAGEASGNEGDPMRFNAVVVGAFADPPAAAADAGPGEVAPACVDQVAFDPRSPDRWWRRRRTALALGEWALAPWGGLAIEAPRRVRLCATPLAWLKALDGWPAEDVAGPLCLLGPVVGLTPGGEGEEARYLRDVIEGAGAIVCDDEDHAAVVYAALRKRPKPPALPEVFIREAGEDNKQEAV